MSNPSSEQIIATYTVRGREFEVTRITWPDHDGLSFDITDKATGVMLNDESFDDEPTPFSIGSQLDFIATSMDNAQAVPMDSFIEENLAAMRSIIDGLNDEHIKRFTVVVDRTELISYVVEARTAQEAEDTYLGDGDETMSRTLDTTIVSVSLND